MKKLIVLLLAVGAVLCQKIRAQQIQTIRGSISDKVSAKPLSEAKIVVLSGNAPKGTYSDLEGQFRLDSITVGQVALRVNLNGYKEVNLANLSLHSGKELVLNIQMEELVQELKEISVQARPEKNKALNEMSTVSTRTFSVEETQKFAAAVNDPARMATAFAGVVAAGDGNNHISIRGNSPNGLLWRMEGVDIPNPNHFSSVGTSGGGISILSAQLLSNSDFSTGAFAAEYGNALSGVFDLRLRKGNNQKREYTFQIGVLGVDVAAEGPFRKGYKGSYLINYRYSTLGVLSLIGVNIGDAQTNFQDVSMNLYFPTKKAGNFSVFGFGGLSYQDTDAVKDSLEWREDSFKQYNSHFYSNTGALGASHTKLFKNDSYLKTILVISGTGNGYEEDLLSKDYSGFKREYEEGFDQYKITLNSKYTRKFSPRTSMRTGIILNQMYFDLNKQVPDSNGLMHTYIEGAGNTQTLQTFVQISHQMGQRFTLNAGVHYLQLMLNNTWSIEPRAAVKYQAAERHLFTLGYGLHSQVQPISIYFARNEAGQQANEKLDLTKAHHLVLGYDLQFTRYMHLKTEAYYQALYQVPISTDPNNRYSILNEMDASYREALKNDGQGRNYGFELTLEHFLNKGFYFLLSGSIYESHYQASNGAWYDTQFNTNFASTLTAGKEWIRNRKGKNRVYAANFKSVLIGGFRYTPFDLKASQELGEAQLNKDEMFAKQVPAYYRLDVRFSLKRNYSKITTIVALDIQNTTNRQNPGGMYYDKTSGEAKYWYQAPLIPILSYKIEF